MPLVNALKTVCDLLLCFSFAALIGPYSEAWLPIGSTLALAFFASLILQRAGRAIAARVLCGLLPALALFTARNAAELVITAIVLAFYFVLTVSGKSELHYEEYTYWFGFPAAFVAMLFLICLSKWPIRRASVVCAALYLFLGVLVLRSKRLGPGAGVKLRLLNAAEPTAAVLFAVLAGALLYAGIKGSIDVLLLPLAYLLLPLIRLLAWFGDLIASSGRQEETTAPVTTEAATGEALIVPESAAAEQGFVEDYAWLSVLLRGALILLALAVLCYTLYRFRGMLSRLRTADGGGDAAIEEGEREPVRFRRDRQRKRQKAAAPSNNEKIRRIYREYLFFMRYHGVEIARRTTSEDVMAATESLAAPEEAQRLRAIYIRARYDGAEEARDADVREAEALLAAIKEQVAAAEKS